MQARLITAQLKLDKVEEAVEFLKDHALPGTRQSSGYSGVLALCNRATGKVFVVTLWDSETDLNVGEERHRRSLTRFEPFFTAPPLSEHFEVLIRE